MRFLTIRIGVLLIVIALCVVLIPLAFVRAAPPPPPLLYAYSRDPDSPAPALFHYAPECPNVWLLCSGRTRRRLRDLHPTYPVVTWSPDGTFVAVRAADARWLFYRADCLLTRIDCLPTSIDGAWSDIRLAWGTDGSVIALPSREGREVRIFTRGCWDGSPPESCATWTAAIIDPAVPQAGLFMPDWSADGARLVFTDGATGMLMGMRAECLDTPETCYDAVESVLDIGTMAYWATLSADGDTVLFFAGASSRSRSQLYAYNLRTGRLRQLSRVGEEAAVFDWSNDGRYVAYSEGSDDQIDVIVMDMARRIQIRTIRTPGWNLYPAWGVNESNE